MPADTEAYNPNMSQSSQLLESAATVNSEMVPYKYMGMCKFEI